MLLYFDAGVSHALKMGVWAVVLYDGGEAILIDRGWENEVKIHKLEKLASEKAAEYARALGVDVILGDCEVSIARAKKSKPCYEWQWVPSAENQADPFTKEYHATP